MTWKARPTTYRGIEMRSRLEATYAAGLDEMGHPWEYEPRAFASQAGQYLPDFVVENPVVGTVYIEVKPTIELAMRALPRVQIVLDSEPDANLCVVVPGAGIFTRWPSLDGSIWKWLGR